jgi:preprotein translocase subunit YajC
MTYTLFAEDPPAQPQQQAPPQGSLLLPFIAAMVLLFWVVVVLPASRRGKREQEAALAALKRGAKVLTSGGIVGTVVSAKDGEDEIVIRSEDTRLRIKRSVVVQVLGSDEAEAAKA